MLCGPQTLWPEPTIKSLVGTNANSFNLNDVQYKIQTPFKTVESLMESTFSVFFEEIKQIKAASGGVSVNDDLKTITKPFKDVKYSGSRMETSTNQRRNFTIVNIYVNVIKTADVHLSLNTDECYNLTMSSMKINLFTL